VGPLPSGRAGRRVVHMTSVHSPADPRIAAKECRSLALAGYDVTLVAPDDGTRPPAEVDYHPVPRLGGMGRRVTRTAAAVVAATRSLRPDLVHFHDPELLPWGLALRSAGLPVVYDVHEDYVSALQVRPWLPDWARGWSAGAWDRIERTAARRLEVVLAERYYQQRFPSGTLVLNYPIVDEALADSPLAFSPGSPRLLYTGNHTVDRGAQVHARLLRRNPQLSLTSVGRCPAELAERMRALAGPQAEQLTIDGVGQYVPFERIRARYLEGGWLLGLALFPRSAHYDSKELTKFYEYMLAGLPVLASDSPTWRAIIEGNGVGRCVDPADDDAVDAALAWFLAHPQEGQRMGARGRELALDRYAWGSQAATLVDLYDRILPSVTDPADPPAGR